jgi:hypothetical protein
MSFHVPEQLRFREKGSEFNTNPGDLFGAFLIVPGALFPWGLKMIASNGMLSETEDTGWEHVSVSRLTSPDVPSWDEMTHVAKLFWDDSDWLVQFRPAAADYVNIHPGVLHWWRWKAGESPRPPKECV